MGNTNNKRYEIYSSTPSKYSRNSKQLHCYQAPDIDLALEYMDELTEKGHHINEMITPKGYRASKEPPTREERRGNRR